MKQEQLCWDCRRATGQCPWTEMTPTGVRFAPVPGWTAKPVIRRVVLNEVGKLEADIGYHITQCPLFLPDPPRLKKQTAEARPQPEPPKAVPALKAVKTGTYELRFFDSVSQAVSQGFTAKGIYRNLAGKQRSHNGWIFTRCRPWENGSSDARAQA